MYRWLSPYFPLGSTSTPSEDAPSAAIVADPASDHEQGLCFELPALNRLHI